MVPSQPMPLRLRPIILVLQGRWRLCARIHRRSTSSTPSLSWVFMVHMTSYGISPLVLRTEFVWPPYSVKVHYTDARPSGPSHHKPLKTRSMVGIGRWTTVDIILSTRILVLKFNYDFTLHFENIWLEYYCITSVIKLQQDLLQIHIKLKKNSYFIHTF